jgi:hypothetical protein
MTAPVTRVEYVIRDVRGEVIHRVLDQYRSIPDFAETWARGFHCGADHNEAGYPHTLTRETTDHNGFVTERVLAPEEEG